MLRLLYNGLAALAAILVPWYLSTKVKEDPSLAERVRQNRLIYPPHIWDPLRGKKVLWIHAASVGEAAAAAPVLEELRRLLPDATLAASLITHTGYATAKRLLAKADVLFYLPPDSRGNVRYLVNQIKPAVFVAVETELWPNLLKELDEHNCAVVLANGRISDQSHWGYPWLGPLLKDMLSRMDRFLMQSEQDADRICDLGADPEKISVTGNTKYDNPQPIWSEEIEMSWRRKFYLAKEEILWIAGSTHAGEEALILDVFTALQSEFPQLRLLLAPRKVERTREIEILAESRHLKTSRRSTEDCDTPVIILDTIGELAGLYMLADLVFVGGSLVPIGGHNIMEPAACGKPVIVGPHMENFRAVAEFSLETGALRQVENGDDLWATVRELLSDNELLHAMGEQGQAVIAVNQGVAIHTAEEVAKLWHPVQEDPV
ncbi:MAG: 3-deoxy-D-manno-octulosonic acid transferase [Negativicutes bacterium]|nr:3-deoxy-D-manno-octulosonic acid transferase [Negativicutes bacterium]